MKIIRKITKNTKIKPWSEISKDSISCKNLRAIQRLNKKIYSSFDLLFWFGVFRSSFEPKRIPLVYKCICYTIYVIRLGQTNT